MAAKVKALQQWCKVMCEGYRDVAVTNMTSSWKSGLAFCAIIHRYRPDLIDYDSLKKEDTYGNSKLAFDVAQNELGIAALLDPEDMVVMTVPDKLCILTYVSQYYNYFRDKKQMGGPGIKTAVKRPLSTVERNVPSRNVPSTVPSTEKQVSPAAKRRTIEDRCCMCHQKVYLLERHYEGGKLYHRHCCREAERTSTLKRNSGKENSGPAGGQKESFFAGNPDASKNRFKFSDNVPSERKENTSTPSYRLPVSSTTYAGGKSTPTVASPAHLSITPASTRTPSPTTVKGPTPSIFGQPSAKNTVTVPSREAPRAVPTTTASSTVGLKLSPFVTGTTKTNLTPTTTASSTVGLKLSPFATGTTKTNLTPTTTASSTVGLKLSPFATGTTKTNLTPSSISTTTKPSYSFGLKFTPIASTVSSPSSSGSGVSALPSSSGPSKYTSIFDSKTTGSQKITSPVPSAVSTSNYTSAVTVSVSSSNSPRPVTVTGEKFGASTPFPSFRLGSDDVKFTVKLGDGKNISSSGNTPTTNNTVVTRTVMEANSGGKGAGQLLKSNQMEGTAGKAEWQLEAERRQAARNGAYVDPEKTPLHSNASGLITGPSSASSGGKTPMSRDNAQDVLVKILQKQLQKGDKNKRPGTVEDVSSSQMPKDDFQKNGRSPPLMDDSWVMIQKPDDKQGGMARSDAFRIGEPGPEQMVCPLTPADGWKKIVKEGTIGFSDKNVDSGKPNFQDSPSLQRRSTQIINPLVPKRKVNAEKKVSMEKINKTLLDLDAQLSVIEAEGRDLEDKIRGGTDEAMDEDDDDDLMHTWFKLVTKKYDLVREESDLIYKRRQQELEEFHEELEYQYRCLSSIPDEEKTYQQRRDEEETLQQLVQIVNQRDNIVDSIEVDRKRYIEEDEKIQKMMQDLSITTLKKSKKQKKKKNKKNHQFAEKDGSKKRSLFKISSK